MKKLLLLLAIVSSLLLATDTFRVIRNGDLVKTTAPIMGTMVVGTSNATLTTGNVHILVKDSAGTSYYIKANTSE